jgi:hypothetical protein
MKKTYKILDKKTGKFIVTKSKINSMFEATKIARKNPDYQIIEVKSETEATRIEQADDTVRTGELFK